MLLILGGTAEAKALAHDFHQEGIGVTYSIAGLVRQADLPCKLVSGGFSQFGGLENYIRLNHIHAVLDATHPFAQKISKTVVMVAKQRGIPCWRFIRPEWQAVGADRWSLFPSDRKLQLRLNNYQSVFLTIGQLDQSWLEFLQRFAGTVLWRTAVAPKTKFTSKIKWIEGIAPFSLEDEITLMKRHNIDCLVTKNSGGDKTYAKLQAARKLGIDVLMLERPKLTQADVEFNELDVCKSFIIDALSKTKEIYE